MPRHNQKMKILSLCAGGLMALGLAACSSSTTSTTTTTTSGSSTTTGPTGGSTSTTSAPALKVKVIGYVLSGPSDDHGYYQDQAQEIEALGKQYGIRIILVQNAEPETAPVFEDLAREGAQVVITDGSEFTPGMLPFAINPAFSGTLPLMISGDPPVPPELHDCRRQRAAAHFLGGVAAALLLEQNGGNTACDVAGPNLDFVKNAGHHDGKGSAVREPEFQIPRDVHG